LCTDQYGGPGRLNGVHSQKTTWSVAERAVVNERLEEEFRNAAQIHTLSVLKMPGEVLGEEIGGGPRGGSKRGRECSKRFGGFGSSVGPLRTQQGQQKSDTGNFSTPEKPPPSVKAGGRLNAVQKAC